MGAIVIWLSISMIKSAGMIVLQGLPSSQDSVEQDGSLISADSIRQEIQTRFMSVVSSVHEVHLWSLVPDQVVGTLHVKFRDKKDYFTTNSAIKDFLASKGVTCLTLQPEFDTLPHAATPVGKDSSASGVNGTSNTDDFCCLQCVKKECWPKTCCSGSNRSSL